LATTYAVTRQPGSCMGDMAKSMGEVVLVASDKLQAVNEKHKPLETTKAAVQNTATTAWIKTKEFESKYQIAATSKRVIVTSGQTAYTKTQAVYEQASTAAMSHPALEQGMQQVKQGCEYVGTKVGVVKGTTTTDGADNPTTSEPTYRDEPEEEHYTIEDAHDDQEITSEEASDE